MAKDKTPTRSRLERPINQAQGPRAGNTGTPSKREKFIEEKSGGWRETVADTIMSALEGRGTGMKPRIDPTVEGLHSDTGPKRNPTAGGTKYNVKTRTPGNTVKK